jgi:hypothetical protein
MNTNQPTREQLLAQALALYVVEDKKEEVQKKEITNPFISLLRICIFFLCIFFITIIFNYLTTLYH